MPPRAAIWAMEPHTEAKHRILRRYLDAWLPTLSRWNGRVVYIDGFAGPGEYSGGEDGSPVIALKAFRDHRYLGERKCEFVCLFIDSERDRIEHLEHVAVPERVGGLPDNVRVGYHHGEFQDQMTEILDNLDAGRRQLAPCFALVDPFGIKGTPMEVLGRILTHKKTEVMVTFVVDHINRFLGSTEFEPHLDALFGDPGWRALLGQENRLDALSDFYAQQLRKHAEYVRSFRMISTRGHPVYDLVFGTNSVDGLEKMKAAMWRVDPVAGGRFSDRTAGVPTLFTPEPDLRQLGDALCTAFRGQTVPMARVQEFVSVETPFLAASHLKRKTLKPLEDEGRVEYVPLPQSAGKRRKGDFPDGGSVRFL